VNSDSPESRIQAANALAAMIPSDRESPLVAEFLPRLLTDENADVRRISLEMLLRVAKVMSDPNTVSEYLRMCATDSDENIRAELAEGLLLSFDTLGRHNESVIYELARDRSGLVRHAIVGAVRKRFEELPASIRQLGSSLVGSGISVKLLSGGGMLVDQVNQVTFLVENFETEVLAAVDIELMASADYRIQSPNPVSLMEVRPGVARQIGFTVMPMLAAEIALNIKVNGNLKEPAIRVTAIRDNPYVYGNPIDSSASFFGRKVELDDIFQAVTKPNKQDILLVGERRSGKTSLIYQLVRHLQMPFVPVMIVLSEAPRTVLGIEQHIVRRITATLSNVTEVSIKPAPHGGAREGLIEELAAVIDAARTRVPDLKIVMLIDEADVLLSVDERLQNILRAALQSMSIGPFLRAVVAGTSALSTFVSNKSSPFFNQFRFVTLTPLLADETRDLVMRPAAALGYAYDASAVALIGKMSGGHPYYCQRLCYEAFALATKNQKHVITHQIAHDAINRTIESTSDDAFKGFKTYFWDSASSDERIILRSIAWNNPLREKSRDATARLVAWQILRRWESTYQFTAELFREWIKRLGGKVRS
jgi:hypothetical protein